MSELKPCPFCGGEAELLEGSYSDDGRGDRPWVVLCKSCNARKTQLPDWLNWNPYRNLGDACETAMRNAVIEAWNTRHERTCTVANLGGRPDSLPILLCERCGAFTYSKADGSTWNYCPNCGARVKED